MTDQTDPSPAYSGTVGGAYSTEEHLKAQQVQKSAQTGQPLHPELADTDTPAAPADEPAPNDPPAVTEPASDTGESAPAPDAEGLGEVPPPKLG